MIRWLLFLCTSVLLACSGPQTSNDSPVETAQGEDEGVKEEEKQTQPPTAGLWVDLSAEIRIPLADTPSSTGEWWLHAEVSRDTRTRSGGVVFEGCASEARGTCPDMARTTLSDADRQAFATHMSDILSMPRCEPLAHGPDDHPFTLTFGEDTRSAHIPIAWFTSGAPEEDDDLCMAEVRMAFWLWQWWEGHRPPMGG